MKSVLSTTYMIQHLIIAAKSPSYLENVSVGVFMAVGCFSRPSIHPRDLMWSLWNPFTSQIIKLPPLKQYRGRSKYKKYDHIIIFCCLSAPPDQPNSLLFLTRAYKSSILCCRIGSVQNAHERMKLRWIEETSGVDIVFCSFHHLTCCNGKVYAVNKLCGENFEEYGLVELDIVVNNEGENKEQAVISLLPVCEFPCPADVNYVVVRVLKGSCSELFAIVFSLVYDREITTTSVVTAVYVFKLDMNYMRWEEMKDLEDTILSVAFETAHDDFEDIDCDTKASAFYSPAINASSAELGGYVHILADQGKIIYSYHVKDKTLSLSSIPCLAGTKNHVSAWAMLPTLTRLESDGEYVDCKQEKEAGDKEDGIVSVKGNHDELIFPFRALKMNEDRLESENAAHSKQEGDKDVNIIVKVDEDDDESPLLNLPPHVLGMLMEEFCNGVEYFKFRSTCKRCQLAAPSIPWNNGKRLQLLSPWLIVFDKHKGIITFTDPVIGDKFFIKTPQELICDLEIKSCRYGWLLIRKSSSGSLVFYNPFTSDIRELPYLHKPLIFSFSAPPTSAHCIVVGTTSYDWKYRVCIFHFVGGRTEPSSWRQIIPDNHLYDVYESLTFYRRDLYALRCDRGFDAFEEIGVREDHSRKLYVARSPPTSSFRQQSFLLRCDEHDLLHVLVGKFGESVEVFKLNNHGSEWVKINDLGKHMIFICETSSFCIDAKTPNMENKIFFARLPTDQNDNNQNDNNDSDIVFYSLETCRYHTFNLVLVYSLFSISSVSTTVLNMSPPKFKLFSVCLS